MRRVRALHPGWEVSEGRRLSGKKGRNAFEESEWEGKPVSGRVERAPSRLSADLTCRVGLKTVWKPGEEE